MNLLHVILRHAKQGSEGETLFRKAFRLMRRDPSRRKFLESQDTQMRNLLHYFALNRTEANLLKFIIAEAPKLLQMEEAKGLAPKEYKMNQDSTEEIKQIFKEVRELLLLTTLL